MNLYLRDVPTLGLAFVTNNWIQKRDDESEAPRARRVIVLDIERGVMVSGPRKLLNWLSVVDLSSRSRISQGNDVLLSVPRVSKMQEVQCLLELLTG